MNDAQLSAYGFHFINVSHFITTRKLEKWYHIIWTQ